MMVEMSRLEERLQKIEQRLSSVENKIHVWEEERVIETEKTKFERMLEGKYLKRR